MATGTYAPDPDLHVVDANGVPVSGGLVWTYIAGTTTPTPTYTDVGLLVPNTNPIVAGSDGRFVAFLAGGISYKFVYEMPATPPAHGAVIATRDNILAVTTIVPGTGGGVVQSTSLTGTVNDLPLLPGCAVLYCTNPTPLTITGLAGGVTGQRLTVISASTYPTYLAHYSSSSLPSSRFANIATSGPTPLGVSGSASYIYRGDWWSLVSHEQGTPIVPPFSAADFATSAGGAWTVTAGNIISMKYLLRGRVLTVAFQIAGTSLAGSPTSLYLANGQFGGFTLTGGAYVAMGWNSETVGVYAWAASGVQIGFSKANGAGFTPGAQYFYGTFTTDVT